MNYRTIDKLDKRAVLKSLDRLELAEIVQRDAIELEAETRAVARLLLVHEHLVDLLNELHGRDLQVEDV